MSRTDTPSLLGRVLLGLIRLYRAALSPLLGPSCRYVPTCSHYAEEAIGHWGPVRGVALGAWRILRCHPFCRGGLDPVPVRPVDPGRPADPMLERHAPGLPARG